MVDRPRTYSLLLWWVLNVGYRKPRLIEIYDSGFQNVAVKHSATRATWPAMTQ